MVPLKYQLQSGDTVEILTSQNQNPNKDWLKFVATGRAKTKIRHHIRTEQRNRSQALGREMLEKELRKYRMSLAKAIKRGKLNEAAEQFRLGSGDELILNVGFGKLMASEVVKAIVPESEQGNGSQALADMRQARRLSPEEEYIHVFYVRALLAYGQTDEARRAVEGSLRELPESPDLRHLLAQMELARGETGLSELASQIHMSP